MASEGLHLRMEVSDSGLRSLLGRLHHQATHRQPLLQLLVDALAARVEQRFTTGKDPNGKAWAPWRERTARRKAKRGATRLMIETGNLLGGLSAEADEARGILGFSAPYAVFHEFGTKRMARRGLLTANSETGALGAGDERLLASLLSRAFSLKGDL